MGAAATRTPARPLAVATALLLVAVAGCLSPSPTSVSVPAPAVGSTYVYEGPGGDLTVTVEELAPRFDGVFRVHDSVVLNLTMRNPTREAECNSVGNAPVCYLGEAVDVAQGLVVQHWNKCGLRSGEPTWCISVRAGVVLDGGGLPGGFGAAPFWNATLEPGTETLEVHPLTLDRQTINYTVEAAGGDDRACVRVETAERVDREGLQTLALAVVDDPFVLCDGVALPVRFTTVDGDTYELVDRRVGDRRVEVGGASAWSEPGDPFPRRAWSPPLAVSDREDANLTVEEAHRFALENSATYRDLFETYPETLVVETHVFITHGSSGPTGLDDERNYRREVVAVAPDGRAVNVTVDKTVRATLPNETEVTDVVNLSIDPPPTRETLPDGLVTVPDAAYVARAITGLPLDIESGLGGTGPTVRPTHYTFSSIARDIPWPTRTTETLTVHPWIEPTERHGLVATPTLASVDAARGHLEAIELNRSRLPLDEPPELPWAS